MSRNVAPLLPCKRGRRAEHALFRIRIGFNADPNPESRVLMTKHLAKYAAKKIKYFLKQKLQFNYSWASTKDVQATEEM